MPSSFVVWIPSPVGYAHAGALVELATAVERGLVKLGHAASLSVSPQLPPLDPGCTCITVGPHVLSLLPPLDLPEGTILYNTEAYGAPPFANALPHLQAHPRVWDISEYNVEQLRRLHGVAAHFIPPGHDAASDAEESVEKDIDVLFYGSINERRRRVLDSLRAESLCVHEVQLPYGEGRDRLIRRSKVVLNLHYYAVPGIFESVRVSHALNSAELVVSEQGIGQFPYDQAAVCVPYDDLVAVCREYARRDELRTSRAKLGPVVMRQFLDTPTLLARALDAVDGLGQTVAAGLSPNQGPTLCLVVLGKDTAAFDAMDFLDPAMREVDELVLLKTEDARFGGFSAIANRVAQRTSCDVVGLVHADTTFAPGSLSKFAASAVNGRGGRQVVGLVGITLTREYVWSREVPPGTERHVSTLDGCSVFFPTSLVTDEDVAFDEQFASFHCGVEDFCLSAHARGFETVVPSAQADHHSGERGTYLQPQWQQAYWKDRKVLTEKWPDTRFETT